MPEQERKTWEISPSVYWAEVMGENKPMIGCGVHWNGEYQYPEGLLDMGRHDNHSLSEMAVTLGVAKCDWDSSG